MCEIEYAEPYYEVRTPAGHVVTRCTDCGRKPEPDEGTDGWETFSGVMSEDIPRLAAWYPIEQRFWTDADWAEWPSNVPLPPLRWRSDKLLPDDDPPPVWRSYPWRDGLRWYQRKTEWLTLREFVTDEGGIPDGVDCNTHTHDTCPQCLAARRWLNEVCNGYIYDGICREMFDHWHEDTLYRSLPMGRIAVTIRRGQWRTRQGTLTPVETVARWVDDSLTQLEAAGGLA